MLLAEARNGGAMDDPLMCLSWGQPAPGVPSVAVLVELARHPVAGGHMKCWERFAEAAAEVDARELGIDLTVYVLGERPGVEPLSAAVRFVTLRPLLSTRALVARTGNTDIADLAPHHPVLAKLLPRHDVWHLTHMFAFASTAARLSRRQRRAAMSERAGIVGSVHTDVPALTAAYVRRMTGAHGASGPARPAGSDLPAPPATADLARRTSAAGASRAGWWPPDLLAATVVRHRRDRLLRVCDRVLVATEEQRAELGPIVGIERVSLLGRGIDRERFRANPAARAELTEAHGIPVDRTIVLFVGRVDASKRALLLAEAVKRVNDTGRAVHLVVVGAGPDSTRVKSLLGSNATVLGPLPQELLAQVYPGCDIFAFPSTTETIGNVVAEAMACELPVVLPAGAQTTEWLAAPGLDGLVVRDDTPRGWAAALAGLVDRPLVRQAMGQRAGATAAVRHRSWGRVLADDLLPLWHEVAPSHTGAAIQRQELER